MQVFLAFILCTLLIISCGQDKGSDRESVYRDTISDTARSNVFTVNNEDTVYPEAAKNIAVTKTPALSEKIDRALENDTIRIDSLTQIINALHIRNKKGIVLYGAADSSRHSGIICYAPVEYLIILENCTNIVLKDLYLSNCDTTGKSEGIIQIKESVDIQIMGNDIAGNSGYGIKTDAASGDIQICGNRIHDCRKWGIILNAPGCKVLGNDFFHNGVNGRYDLLISEEAGATAFSDNNNYIGAEYQDYIADINTKATGNRLSRKFFNIPDDGSGINVFYDNDSLVFIQYQKSNDKDKNINLYLKNGKPVHLYEEITEYIEPDPELAETDEDIPLEFKYEDKVWFYNGFIARWMKRDNEEYPDFTQIRDEAQITQQENHYKQLIKSWFDIINS